MHKTPTIAAAFFDKGILNKALSVHDTVMREQLFY